MTSAPAIGFDYRPSRVPRQLLAMVAALACVAIALSGVPLGFKLVLGTGVLFLALAAARRSARSRIAGVGYGSDGWALYQADRSQLPATLLSHRVIGTCVLLRLQTDRATEILLLAPDNSDPDIRRRLRMRLAAQSPAAGIL
ncbi:protein YgfX [Frateuria terrea]|uniref:Toxin CptA n=1 Tax=Frateuria terrea TaxID=529704 RepID=A0A1H6U3P7_9GAMM|nr:protein YgfX [Frateuria terrea]SEI83015.1 toxin CptA [Frateuria terrea]SFP40496.1 toxin CptA [Frateuria terrea]